MTTSKQDRQGVRTPADIERKYDLGAYGSSGVSNAKIMTALTNLTATVSQFVATTNARLSVLEKVILPTKGEIFYTFTDKKLSDVGASGDTLCDITAIAEGIPIHTAGTYNVTFTSLNLSTSVSLTLTLGEDISTALNVGDRVYFCENVANALCLAYAVKQ